MDGLGIWFGISNTFVGVWSNGVGQNKETHKEHDEDCVEEGFQLDSIKFDRDCEEVREGLSRGIVVSIFEIDQN